MYENAACQSDKRVYGMSSSANRKRMAIIVAAAEAHFGENIQKVTAPGGEGRSSFRLFLPDRSVIATLRPNFRRTHLEAYVLTSLNRECDDLPECLGVVGEVMFQSDVGGKRLNREIARHGPAKQAAMAHQAVSAIFRIQSAARRTDLHDILPHLGSNSAWVTNFIGATNALEPYSRGRAQKIDQSELADRIAWPGQQFVKWDCRSGNAAIGFDDKMRWFDFEYSGLRHGAEDLAWLIGDEAWPLAPETMLDIVRDCYDPQSGHDIDAYLDYLSLYLSLHAVQRFKLIIKEVAKRGWLSKTRIRKFDDAGLHPEFAAQICHVGEFFAARNKLTGPLAYDFAEAAVVFEGILAAGQKPVTQDGPATAVLNERNSA